MLINPRLIEYLFDKQYYLKQMRNNDLKQMRNYNRNSSNIKLFSLLSWFVRGYAAADPPTGATSCNRHCQ